MLLQLQREMSILYARFYAALLGGILLASWLHKWAPLYHVLADSGLRS